MIVFRTNHRDLFVGFLPEHSGPAFMTLDTIRQRCGGIPERLPHASFKWDDGRYCIAFPKNDRAVIYGGWSLYLEVLQFAMECIYRRGSKSRRGRYAWSLANRLVMADEFHSPNRDELRGMIDAMTDVETWGERKYFQNWGRGMLATLQTQPTVELSFE